MTHLRKCLKNYTLTFSHCLDFYRPRKIICFQPAYSAPPLRFACGRIKEQRVVISLTEYQAGFQNFYIAFSSLAQFHKNYLVFLT